jgi:hypothetical protein
MKRFFILLFSISLIQANAQYRAANIAFYNLENLFDYEDDPKINDQDYLPTGRNEWTKERYQEKLMNMAEVIYQLGDQEGGTKWNGPTFLGVCEIENRRVLEDLIATPRLKDKNYGIIQYDSPDKRGIDVAFFYKKDYFKVLGSKVFSLINPDEPDRTTRDQLLVSGIYDDDTLHFIVNHWPSRAAASPARENAANLCRSIVDSLLSINPKAKIFIMGDFNDTPVDKSINYLVHKSVKKKPETDDVIVLFNPFAELHKKGYGTIAHADTWSVFDMIIISPGVVEGSNNGYKYKFADRWDRPWLHQQTGKYKGYPLRTHAGGVYLGGYSDHLPVYMYIVKEVK